MYTNTMRFTGMSGVDTQSMVEQLMRAESMKLYRYEKLTQTLNWKQEAYRTTANTLNKFKTDYLDILAAANMRSKSSYTSITSKVQSGGVDSSAVTVKSTSGVTPGDYKIDVTQLATKDSYQSKKVFQDGITAKLDPMMLKDGDNLAFSLDGTSKKITFDSNDIQAIKDASAANGDVNAVFEGIMNKKLETAFGQENGTNKASVKFVSDKNFLFTTTSGHELKISEGTGVNSSVTGGTPLPDQFTFGTTEQKMKVTIDGKDEEVTIQLKDSMTRDEFVAALNTGLKAKGVSAKLNDDKQLVLSAPSSAQNINLSDTNDSLVNLMGFSSGSVTIERSLTGAAFGIEKSGVSSNIDLTKSISEIFGMPSDTIDFTINGVNFEGIDPTTTSVKDLMNKINQGNAGVKVSFDTLNKNFTFESTNSGAINKIDFGTNPAGNTLVSMFDLNQVSTAQDAIFKINNVETTRTSNNVSFNGLSMTLNQVTTDGNPVTVTVNSDTTAVKDNIKKFIQGYNELIEGMNDLVNTNRAKTGNSYYDPLTADQKKAMSTDEIKQWEDKAKTGMLYRDDILTKITSDLRSQLYQSVELPSGKKLSLYEIGITTTNDYQKGGQLVIDEKKLQAALDEYGEDVADLFTKTSSIAMTDTKNSAQRLKEEGIAERMYDIISNATSLSGPFAMRAGFENSVTEKNNRLYKELKTNLDKMDEIKAYLVNKENYYYSMFSKMESAIQQSNGQMSYLSAQLGQ